MGPWSFVRERIQDLLGADQELAYAGRRESASPATGSGRLHREQQAELIAAAFNGLPS
jgi:2-oxoglutarate dehydrogenase E1 component